jgi:dTDP-4-dehydrorhamnose reductase
MVRILITGSNGQLGSEFRAIAIEYPHFAFLFTDVDELDITDEKKVREFFEQEEPDVVINCAAYTAVDKAEDEPVFAWRVNRDAVANLTRSCDLYDNFLVHISTDYVFDGANSRPYREDDIPAPRSVYGLSKLEGEEAMQSCLQRGLIIRTSWLYSSFGSNFVKTILKKCAEGGELKVVSDQIGSPTYARDLARCILDILPAALSNERLEIFHYANQGQCSWYDFALEIARINGIPCTINATDTEGYPTKAPRPAYSVLDTSLLRERFGICIPHWSESLTEFMKLLPLKR